MPTRKEFVLNVVEEMKSNPRSVLAGHGINATVLQQIVARPDVMSKLATFLYSLKAAKKGAKGLKKAQNFKISGYKSFPEFNMKAREDVETFIGQLAPDDAGKFTNEGNIMTILMLPQEAGTDEIEGAAEIVSGKSVAVTFNTSVKKEYKIAGGFYLTVMIGDSAVRVAEEKVAKRKEKVNKKKQSKRTPAKLKAELKAKANKKLNALKAKRIALEDTAATTAAELEQLAAIGSEFGAGASTAPKVRGAIKNFDAAVDAAKADMATLDADGKAAVKYAMKAMKAGDKRLMNVWLKEVPSEAIKDYIRGGAVSGGSKAVLRQRKQALKDQLEKLAERSTSLLASLESETDAKKKLSIRSMISKNNAKVKQIRAKLGTYKNLSYAAMSKKAAMLKKVHAEIEANIEKGNGINQALNNAIMSLDAKLEEKKIIKQQVMEQVAEGMPVQYAVQQAIQQTIQEPVMAEEVIPDMNDSMLSGNTDIKDLLATL